MSLTMFADAIKFSTEKQVGAIFDHAQVSVDLEGMHYQSPTVRITVDVTHRGKHLRTGDCFPVFLVGDPSFYENFLREGLSKRVSGRIMNALMQQALE